MAVSTTSNQIAGIENKQLFEVRSWDAIEQRCDVPEIRSIVEQNVQTYYTINVEDAMKKLTQVGQLLQLAYSGSKGFSCSTVVLKVLSSYQNLVKESVLTSSTFVEVVLKALSFHKLAIVMVEKEKMDKALKMLGKCAEFAQRMAEESNKLAKKSDELTNLSEKALLKANDNRNVSEEEKKKMIEKTNEYEAERAKKEQMAKVLAVTINEAEEEAAKHGATATTRERIGMAAALFPVLGLKLSNTACKSAAEAREREAKANELKRKLQAEARESNSELAGILEALKNSHISKDDLEKAIMSLEISIKTLGKVKTVFLNTKQFWEGVHKHCKSLTANEEAEELCDPDLKDEFMNAIKQSGFCWLSLGKINRTAALAIRAVDETVDNIMNDLPTKEEADKLIDELASTILGDIQTENKMISYEMENDQC